jgi:acetylornithine deacetylase
MSANAPVIDKGNLFDTLRAMVAIDSVNPSLVPGGRGEADIAAWLGERMTALGLEVEVAEIAPSRYNAVGILRGTGGGRSLLLNGHTDTVGVEGMTIPPFLGDYRDGRLYGRGTMDMKGGVAAQLAAVKALVDAGLRPKGDVILGFVADEEYASLGTEVLLRTVRADAGIVCEPTDLGVCVAHKGFVWARVDVAGVAAHGSRPLEGVDAIVKAGKFLAELEALEERLKERTHPLLGAPSVHASTIRGGRELSTYPDFCRIELERRTLPGENSALVERELQTILREIRSRDNNFRANLEILFSRPPLEVDPSLPIVEALRGACSHVLGRIPDFSGMSGWLDSALLAEAGIPTVIFGPTGYGLHGAEEFVEFDSVAATAGVLAETILTFCGS